MIRATAITHSTRNNIFLLLLAYKNPHIAVIEYAITLAISVKELPTAVFFNIRATPTQITDMYAMKLTNARKLILTVSFVGLAIFRFLLSKYYHNTIISNNQTIPAKKRLYFLQRSKYFRKIFRQITGEFHLFVSCRMNQYQLSRMQQLSLELKFRFIEIIQFIPHDRTM